MTKDYEQSTYTGDALYAIDTWTILYTNIKLAYSTCQGFPAPELGLCLVALDEFPFHDHVHVGGRKCAEARGQSGGSLDLPKGTGESGHWLSIKSCDLCSLTVPA